MTGSQVAESPDRYVGRASVHRDAPIHPGLEELARILERSADPYPGGLPPPVRRGLRAVTQGLLRPDAANVAQQERGLVARVRARRREPRLVAFAAGKGGVGTTTTAAGVALTLAALRSDPTCLVDARSGTWSLGQRLAGQPGPGVAQLADQPPAGRIGGLLGVVDGAPWHQPAQPHQFRTVLDALRQEHTSIVVDVGNEVSDTASAVLDQADQLVVVTTTSMDAVQATRLAFARVRELRPDRLDTVVVAITSLRPGTARRDARRLRTALGLAGGRVVAIPFDPALAAGDRLRPAQLRAPTREAFLRLAGVTVEPGPPQAVADRALAPAPGILPRQLEVWPAVTGAPTWPGPGAGGGRARG